MKVPPNGRERNVKLGSFAGEAAAIGGPIRLLGAPPRTESADARAA